MIDKVDGNVMVIDRGSRLGIIVNGKLIKESCILNKEENELLVGSSYSPFVFKVTIKDEGKLNNVPKEPEGVDKKYEEVNVEEVENSEEGEGGQ